MYVYHMVLGTLMPLVPFFGADLAGNRYRSVYRHYIGAPEACSITRGDRKKMKIREKEKKGGKIWDR